MSTTLTTSDQATLSWLLQNTADGLSPVPFAGQFRYAPERRGTGTGAGEADVLYAAIATIVASGSLVLTLSSFNDYFANATGMKRWKTVFIGLPNVGDPDGPATVQASSITANPAGASHPINFADTTAFAGQVKQGGTLISDSGTDAIGNPMTAGSNDKLTITNNDSVNAATVQIAVVGCSA